MIMALLSSQAIPPPAPATRFQLISQPLKSFLTHGFDYKHEIIKERTGKTANVYLKELKKFIKDKITQDVINQDLNFLLPYKQFNSIRKTLKTEVLMLLGDEIKKLAKRR